MDAAAVFELRDWSAHPRATASSSTGIAIGAQGVLAAATTLAEPAPQGRPTARHALREVRATAREPSLASSVAIVGRSTAVGSGRAGRSHPMAGAPGAAVVVGPAELVRSALKARGAEGVLPSHVTPTSERRARPTRFRSGTVEAGGAFARAPAVDAATVLTARGTATKPVARPEG